MLKSKIVKKNQKTNKRTKYLNKKMLGGMDPDTPPKPAPRPKQFSKSVESAETAAVNHSARPIAAPRPKQFSKSVESASAETAAVNHSVSSLTPAPIPPPRPKQTPTSTSAPIPPPRKSISASAEHPIKKSILKPYRELFINPNAVRVNSVINENENKIPIKRITMAEFESRIQKKKQSVNKAKERNRGINTSLPRQITIRIENSKPQMAAANNNNNFESPQYRKLFQEFDAFVWDFDKTLAHYPSSSIYNRSPKENSNVSLNRMILFKIKMGTLPMETICQHFFYQFNKFIELVLYLISKGKKVAIMSLGNKNIIRIILEKSINYYYEKNNIQGGIMPFTSDNIYAGGKSEDDYISGEDDLSYFGIRKWHYMTQFIEKEKINPDRIIFFDDDYQNTGEMIQKGVSSVEINSKRGFYVEILKKINQYLIDNESKNNKKIKVGYDFEY
jgi:hypothetical protein